MVFKDERNISQLLFGVIIIICWIVVSEGFIAIFKVFTRTLVIIPLLILPLVLAIVQKRRGHSENKTANGFNLSTSRMSWEIGDFCVAGVFAISFLSVLLTTLYVRTDKMIFSVWEVLPSYFWPLMFANIVTFILLQKKLQKKRYGFEVSIISSFLTAFLYFGLMVLVVKTSFDPDIWGLLSGVRVIFDLGGRDPTGSTFVIQYSGYQAFLATFAMLGGNTFNLTLTRWITWLWSPIMASVYIPFITYQFLKKSYSNHNISHIFLLGVIGFMLFPTFWLMSVSVAEMVGDILLYVNLFFITIFISDTKPYRGLFLTALTTIAVILVHPISGTFALMADLVALPFHPRLWKMKNLRYLLLLVIVISALSMFPLQFSWVQGFLFKSSLFQLHAPSLEATTNFWLSPLWLPNQYTADSICSENFNWIRYVLLIAGFLALRSAKNNERGRVNLWLLSTVIVFWVSWFITVNGIPNLPYGPHRFARDVDIALIPFAAAILYNLSKINSISLVINEATALNKIISITLVKSKKRLGFSFSQARISAIIIMSLTIVALLSSFYVAYFIPSLSKNYPAEPGRPTWRTVTADEMKIVQLINASSGAENYCVLSHGFIPQLVEGILGYRYCGNEPNLAIASGTIMNSTSQLIFKPYPSLIYKSMVATNSSLAFFVTEDWYIKGSSVLLSNIEKLRQFASNYQVLGSDYKFYFFKFDLSTIITRLYQYVYPVEKYDVRSPTVIADDEQPNYWSTFEELSGNIGKPLLSIRNDTKISGNYSTEALIENGTYGRVGFYKNFNNSLDLSSQKYISFFMYGTDSTATVIIYFMAPNPADSQLISFTLDWEGWRFIKIPLEDFTIVRGNPDLSRVMHISIQFTDVTPGTCILIDEIEVSK